MNRLRLVGLALVSLPLWAGSAQAIEWWHDPERGCGTLDSWQRNTRIKDLPGCDGELPKGAPPGEVAMHDAKKLLHEAEKALDAGQTGDVEAKLDQATNIMNKAPNDPRVNWVRPHYQKALGVLRARALIVPRLPKLRTSYNHAAEAVDQANRNKSDATRKAATTAAEACVAAFKEAESQGVDLSVPVELTPGKLRPLRDDLRDCSNPKLDTAAPAAKAEETQKAAEPAKESAAAPDKAAPAAATPKKGGDDGGVPRGKWLKALKGDRKKIFQEHDDAFPEYDGDPGPKGAAKADEWRYGSEVYKFKRNKLVKPKNK